MIDVIESVCKGPIRFIGNKDTIFEPGMIMQLEEVDGTPTCVISDGTRPFGIIEKVDSLGLVHIWFDTMIVRTDKFEPDAIYKSGNSIYVSAKGLLTTDKLHVNSQLVGHVISGPDAQQAIEVNWI